MAATVEAWRQEGTLTVWRYASPRKLQLQWHFHADGTGCESFVDLVARFQARGRAGHRTLNLSPITPDDRFLPDLGRLRNDRFEKLRVEFAPSRENLQMDVIGDRLTLAFGGKRAAALSAAFTELGAGIADFAIAESDDKQAASWWFW